MTLSKTATLGLSETRRTTMRGGGIKKIPSLIPGFKSPFPHKNKKNKTRSASPCVCAATLRSSKLPGPCVRRDWLCHLSAAEAVTQYCGFPSRNDDGFRDFAWQKSASLRSHESRACHWAGRDTAIRPLCHSGTIG